MESTRRERASGLTARRSTKTWMGLEKSRSSKVSGVANSWTRPFWYKRLNPRRWSSRSAWRMALCWVSSDFFLSPQRLPVWEAETRSGYRTWKRRPGATAGKEQAQIVVNFRGSGHGGARIARAVLLANGDGRSNAGDLVHFGLFHAFQELAGVGGKRVDVTALAFGVNGVKGKGGFAGTADARDDGDGVVRNFDRHILEIVDARAADEEGVAVAGLARDYRSGLGGCQGGSLDSGLRARCLNVKLYDRRKRAAN